MSLGYVVAQLLLFPIGKAWERLPRWRVPLGRFTFDVNPGKFTIKEHAVIVIVSRFQYQSAGSVSDPSCSPTVR
jgi:hypothetical protein